MLTSESKQVDTTARAIVDTTSKLTSGTLSTYTSNLPGTSDFSYIYSETAKIYDKSDSFSNGAYAYEVVRFSWVWVQLFISMIAIGITFVAYSGAKMTFLLKIATFLLYALIITHLAFLAYMTSELFVALDMCEQIYYIVHLNSVPSTQVGIAYYLRPFSDVSPVQAQGV